jgi:hypothetical protein
MYNPDNDLLFHPRIIPALRGLRGPAWEQVAETAQNCRDDSPEKAAFVLMMTRLNGCASCDPDSLRAMNGCTTCSRQTVTRLRQKDEELAALFEETRQELQNPGNNHFIQRE